MQVVFEVGNEEGSETGVGVYLCTCEGKLDDLLDYGQLAERLREVPGVVTADVVESLCSVDGQHFLAEQGNREDIEAVVVGACTPKVYEHFMERALDGTRVGKYRFEQVNLREQCAWTHAECGVATNKAAVLLAGGVARAAALEPLEDVEVCIEPRVLVIGGGVTGMQVAQDVAREGYKVELVEREPRLGGRAYELDITFPTHDCGICCIQSCRLCAMTPKIEDILHNPNINVHLKSTLEKVEGGFGARKVTIKTPDGELELDVGIIVVATGSKVTDPLEIPEYYSDYPDVVTALELEHMVSDQREEKELKRPSDNKPIRRVNIALCAGARSPITGHPQCSMVCCTYGIGMAKELKRRYPDIDVNIHYIDLRSPYRGFEIFTDEARELGVNFIRGRLAEVIMRSNGLLARGEDIDLGEPISMETDLVALSLGQEPSDVSLEIAEELHLELDDDGFIKYVNPAIALEERNGVFVAGCAQGLKGIRYSIEDAKLTASHVLSLLRRGTVFKYGSVAAVDVSRCRGCGRCADGCEFDALLLEKDDDGALKASVDTLLCQGCGHCSTECCNGAIELMHYRRTQTLPQLRAVVEGGR